MTDIHNQTAEIAAAERFLAKSRQQSDLLARITAHILAGPARMAALQVTEEDIGRLTLGEMLAYGAGAGFDTSIWPRRIRARTDD